jgi:site-specific DNA-adenine methylase
MIKIPRTPKILRIHYKGSKQEIAYSIILFLYQRHPRAKYFYDLFGGGASISLMAKQFGYKVFYNEINSGMCNLLKFLKGNKIPEEWYEWVSREKFYQHINKNDPYSQMVKICYSFGNGSCNYLFGKNIEQYKKLSPNIVVYEDKKSIDGYSSNC